VVSSEVEVGARCGTIMGLGDRLGGGDDLEAMSLSTWLLSSPSSMLIVLITFVCRLNVAVRLDDHHHSSWSRGNCLCQGSQLIWDTQQENC